MPSPPSQSQSVPSPSTTTNSNSVTPSPLPSASTSTPLLSAQVQPIAIHTTNNSNPPTTITSSNTGAETDESSVALASGNLTNGGGGGVAGAAFAARSLGKGVGQGYTIRKLGRPTSSQQHPAPPPPPSSSAPSAPSSSTTASPSLAAPPLIFPALHLTPLNETFVPKQLALSPEGVRVKIGRQTNVKTIPNVANGYFDSKVLSRMHAEVWSEEGKVFIKDVKSSNGTFINGERLSAEAAESDTFELHSDDVVEFGIDIVSEDNKTIVHHKVAARVFLVMNPDDAIASSREFNNWYRAAGEAPVQRRPVKSAANGSNGLSFEHVLNRLQGELQKSRDTGSNLGEVTSTLHEVHDTLSGGAPPSLPPYPHPSRVPPYIPNANKDLHAQSIAALQSQLNETQSSLAANVGKIQDLEGILAEHDLIRREVGGLRKMIEDSQRDMESVMRARDSLELDQERRRGYGGRESPVAALLEEQEEADEADDAASVASGETIRIATKEQFAQLRGATTNGRKQANGSDPFDSPSSTTTTNTSPSSSTSAHTKLSTGTTIAREEHLQEQNAKLAARLEAISLELDEATKIGQSLRSQHAEAASTIRTLEDRVQGLEKAVEGRVAEGLGLREAEVRWNGWKVAFEESWKKEKRDWDEERGKLVAVVREWEEKKRLVGSNRGAGGGEGSSESGEESDGETSRSTNGEIVSREGSVRSEEGSNDGKLSSSTKKSKSKKQRKRARIALLAKGMEDLSSGVAEALGEETKVKGIGANSLGTTKAGEASSSAESGFDASTHSRTDKSASSQALPYGAAGAVLIIGVAAAWALNLKMKE